MNVYLLIDKETSEVVRVYKYSEVAVMELNKETPWGAIRNAMVGDKPSEYRVEVMKVIE